MMMGFTLAMMRDAFVGGFGAVAAIVLVGGAVMLRWQRTRLQYSLLQATIEKGGTPIPAGVPLWLVSLRQGVMILVLGLALVACGIVAYGAANRVTMPANSSSNSTSPAMLRGDDRPPPPPSPPEGPDQRDQMHDRARPPAPPPRPDPALERWHRAQDQKAVAGIAMGGGVILVLLGIVRIVFAYAERKYPAGSVGML